MKERARLYVSGRVQGVFFRKYAASKAREFSLAGWAHNLIDGRVEILVEGDAENMQQFIVWARKGSGFARVDDLQIQREPYKGDVTAFEVREFGF